MNRVVVVSNRLPDLASAKQGGVPSIPAGGLAPAVFSALRGTRGNLWLGWSGRSHALTTTEREVLDVHLIGIPLSAHEIEHFYNGFSNSVLWPLFHCFPGRVSIDPEQEHVYRSVQGRFARALGSRLEPGDQVWVNDYHLLLLARELRRGGWRGRTGFFLHIPFPPHDLFSILPAPRDFLDALLDFDLMGFHIQASLENYALSAVRELGARWEGEWLIEGQRRQRLGVYPVGIDPEGFLPVSARRRKQGGELVRVIGVDRLDYTKGIPERLLAYRQFLESCPEWRKRVILTQVASPSRTRVASYVEQKELIDSLVGRINGELGEPDWVPVRYLYRSYPRKQLAALYREAAVGLVTPLRDGMNLVAKEYVAAQDPEDPGVLVLSRFAGAAEDLAEAVIVNPYVPHDVAAGLKRALEQPLGERRERHRALLERITQQTARDWARGFLDDLRGSGDSLPGPLPAPSARSRAGAMSLRSGDAPRRAPSR